MNTDNSENTLSTDHNTTFLQAFPISEATATLIVPTDHIEGIQNANDGLRCLRPFLVTFGVCTLICQLGVVMSYPEEFSRFKLNSLLVTGLALNLSSAVLSLWMSCCYSEAHAAHRFKHFIDWYMPIRPKPLASLVLLAATISFSVALGIEISRSFPVSLSLHTQQANQDIFCAEVIPGMAFLILSCLAHALRCGKSIKNSGYAQFFTPPVAVVAPLEAVNVLIMDP